MVGVFLRFTIFIVALSGSNAFSETNPVLPYATATTDCLAREIKKDKMFSLDAVREDIHPFILRAMDRCSVEGGALMAAYDKYYGAGKGLEFVTGPYYKDLPRALFKRFGVTEVGSASYPLDIYGWIVDRYIADGGRFSFCSGESKYKNGFTLRFIKYVDNSLAISIYGKRLHLRDGSRVDIFLDVDGGSRYNISGKALGIDHLFMRVDDIDIINQLIKGNVLSIYALGERVRFSLDKTALMLGALSDCVSYYVAQDGAPQRSAPGANPSPSSTAPSYPPDTSKPKNQEASPLYTGTGFFVASDGIGVTNAHVVQGCQTATITGYGQARVTARDVKNDLALIKLVDQEDTAVATIRTRPVQLGETAYVMGFPLAGQLDNGMNFTNGLISSLAGIGNDTREIQFTAPIQPGNSGGPIVDSAGLVIGVASSKLNDMASFKDSGSIPQNVNFGIKADLLSSFLRANGTEPTSSDGAVQKEAPAIAGEGRRYTFQILCKPK